MMYSWLWPSLPPYFPFMKVKHTLDTVYPFNHPRKYYFCYARIGIYHLARKLNRLGFNQALFPAYHHGVELEAMVAGGVHPVYYNIHLSGEIDVEDLERKITPETRVLYIIHYHGFPQNMSAVMALKRKHDLILIEDAALSLFAQHGNKSVGEFGEAAVFCLYKTLPVPNGGLLVINQPELDINVALRRPDFRSMSRRWAALQLYWCGSKINGIGQQIQKARARVREASLDIDADPMLAGESRFDVSTSDLGISRLSEFIIDRGDVQEIIQARRRNFEYLTRLLETGPFEVQPMYRHLPPGAVPLYFPILLQNRQRVHRELLSQGIESGLVWPLGQASPPGINFPEVALLKERVLALPIHQLMSRQRIEHLAEKLQEVLKAYPQKRAGTWRGLHTRQVIRRTD